MAPRPSGRDRLGLKLRGLLRSEGSWSSLEKPREVEVGGCHVLAGDLGQMCVTVDAHAGYCWVTIVVSSTDLGTARWDVTVCSATKPSAW